MVANRVGKLIQMAKGEDRTIREYARDAGVDASVISKIIRGKYIPRKPKIYEELTSVKAAPRGGVTYEKLIDAAEYSTSYKEGIATSMAVAHALTSIGSIPIIAMKAGITGLAVANVCANKRSTDKSEGVVEKADEIINAMQRFSAISIGIIYGNMTKKGIRFSPEDKKEVDLQDNMFDTYVHIEGSEEIEDYIFGYVYLNDEDRKSEFIVENTGRRAIERLVFLKPNAKRKVSIVVNCKEVYENLLKFKGKLSYKGNLSIILVDTDKVNIESEDYMAFYDDNKMNEVLKIV